MEEGVIYIGEGLNKKKVTVSRDLMEKILAQGARKSVSINSQSSIEEEDQRIIKAFHGAFVNGGNLKQAMIDAGYPESRLNQVSSNRLINTPTFQKLVQFYFPPQVLFEEEASLLYGSDKKYKDKSLDRIHKLLGNFKTSIELSARRNDMNEMTDDELRKMTTIEAEIINEDGKHESSATGEGGAGQEGAGAPTPA